MQGYQKYIPECMNTLEYTFFNAGDDSWFKLQSSLFISTKFHEIVSHSMAMDNLNKSKETTQTATTTLKVAPLGDHYPQKSKLPLLDQNLLSKSTFECEDCAARFTS